MGGFGKGRSRIRAATAPRPGLIAGRRPAAPALPHLAAVSALTLAWAASPAQAQFVCTTTGADQSCTNAGTSGSFTPTTAGNITTTNSGTVNGDVDPTAGGNATATNSGTITQSMVAATNAGGNVTVTNSGSIGQTLAADALAGGNASGTNTGNVGAGFNVSVTGTGGNASGTNSGTVGGFIVSTTRGNATATNSGTVIGFAEAETNGGGNATAANSGTIVQALDVAASGTGNAVATNTGTIGFLAVVSASGNATAINSGTLTQGLFVGTNTGGNASATNSGLINGGVTISLNAGGTSSLANSGTIKNTLGPAIQFQGGPDTLNLLAGSTIIGSIQLAGVHDSVNFLSGNHNLTFGPTFLGSAGLSHATVGGAIPFAVSGNQAAAVDPTPFALADRNLMDFTRGVSSILGSLGGASAAPTGPGSSAFAPSDSMAARIDAAFAGLGIAALGYAGNDAPVFKAPTMVDQYGPSVWARAFGGDHVQDADGPLAHSSTRFAGGAVGFDMVMRPDLRLGLFVGGGETHQALDMNLGHTDSDTVFGGVYGRWGFASFGAPAFLDFALHGGGASNSTARTINNNTLPGGIEIATASYNSAYISPEATYGVDFPLWSEYTLTPSIGVRYVAGMFDGYTESGTTAPLTVSSRTIQDIEERGQVKLTRTTLFGGGDALLTSVHVGVLGLERVGDTTVSTVLLGANLPFVTPGKSTVAGVLGGGGLEWRTHGGVSFFGAAEAIGFSDSSTVYDARGGIRVAF